jgi:hypothetical protein
MKMGARRVFDEKKRSFGYGKNVLARKAFNWEFINLKV